MGNAIYHECIRCSYWAIKGEQYVITIANNNLIKSDNLSERCLINETHWSFLCRSTHSTLLLYTRLFTFCSTRIMCNRQKLPRAAIFFLFCVHLIQLHWLFDMHDLAFTALLYSSKRKKTNKLNHRLFSVEGKVRFILSSFLSHKVESNCSPFFSLPLLSKCVLRALNINNNFVYM